jgi:hypothetical protein
VSFGGGSVVTILRPLSTSELLDRTFHLYRNNFLVFVGIVAIPQLAVLAFQLLLAGTMFGNEPKTLGVLTIPLWMISLVCGGVSQAATVYVVSNVHLNRSVQLGQAFSRVGKDVVRVVWISFVVSLIFLFGLALLIAPGIYWGLMYALAIPVTVLEGSNLSESLSRSADLTENNRGRIFAIVILFTVLTFVVSTCVQYVLGLKPVLLGGHSPAGFTAMRLALMSISAFLTRGLVGPLVTIAMTLVYYDQRVRKEGFDLQLMISTLENRTPSASPALAL